MQSLWPDICICYILSSSIYLYIHNVQLHSNYWLRILLNKYNLRICSIHNCQVTMTAMIYLFLSVCYLMAFERHLICICHITTTALTWLFSCVAPLMSYEILFISEWSITSTTFIWFLSLPRPEYLWWFKTYCLHKTYWSNDCNDMFYSLVSVCVLWWP